MAGDAITTEQKAKGNRIRWTLLIFTWMIMALVAAQVLFIGLGLLYNSPAFLGLHVGAGWALGHLGALLLIAGFIMAFWGGIGPKLVTMAGIDAFLVLLLPYLAGMRNPDMLGPPIGTLISGLHPITALTVFGVSFYLAMNLRALIASTPKPATPSGTRLTTAATTPDAGGFRAAAAPTQNVVAGRIPPPAGNR